RLGGTADVLRNQTEVIQQRGLCPIVAGLLRQAECTREERRRIVEAPFELPRGAEMREAGDDEIGAAGRLGQPHRPLMPSTPPLRLTLQRPHPPHPAPPP